jgi:hypothetical protein
MSEINVTFELKTDREDKYLPVTVEVSELLFEDNGGNLTEMDEEDKQEFDEFILNVTPKEAIETAIETIFAAPGYDHIPVDEVDRSGVEATVEFTNLER